MKGTKLPQSEVEEIAKRYASGESPKALAELYDIKVCTVRAYVRRTGGEIRPVGRVKPADWRAPWFWGIAKKLWPEDVAVLDTVGAREIYGSEVVTLSTKMAARFEAFDMLRQEQGIIEEIRNARE